MIETVIQKSATDIPGNSFHGCITLRNNIYCICNTTKLNIEILVGPTRQFINKRFKNSLLLLPTFPMICVLPTTCKLQKKGPKKTYKSRLTDLRNISCSFFKL